jgi:type VI secretion system secreted protein VgrG
VREIPLKQRPDGTIPPATVPSGARYRFRLQRALLLVRRYHDDAPVIGAEFDVELADGSVVKGRTDENGQGRIAKLPSQPKRVRFGPDARDYRELAEDNPEYRHSLGEDELDEFVRERLG